MQTPAGHEIRDGIVHPVSWLAIVFNPSFPYRFTHMMTAVYLTTSLVILAVGARYLLARKHLDEARTMMRMAVGMIAILAPLQLFIGDQHGLNTLEHQPVKVMAMEGHFESHPGGAPLILFGMPDQQADTVRWAVEIPKLSSLILKHDLNAPLDGLDTVPDEDEPPVAVVFWSFRVMVSIGLLMAGVGLWSLVSRFRGRLHDDVGLHRAALVMAPSGLVAVLAGWITTEVGRQPWVVYGHLRTAEAASPIAASAVGSSLIAFIAVYFAVFGVGVLYLLRLMNRPPEPGEGGPRSEPGPIRTAGVASVPQEQA
jgi:cytochrome d ubiquinol oxidase subunit I